MCTRRTCNSCVAHATVLRARAQEKRTELEAHAHHLKDELRAAESRRLQAEAELDRLKLEVRLLSLYPYQTRTTYTMASRMPLQLNKNRSLHCSIDGATASGAIALRTQFLVRLRRRRR